jgi:uncharacterized protein Yka (UPF0111/DUF47 family)
MISRRKYGIKKGEFFRLFSEQSQLLVKSVEALENFCKTSDHRYANLVDEFYKKASEKRRILTSLASELLITPIEREDIYDISRVVDDIFDYIRSTVEEFEAYCILPTLPVLDMVVILKRQVTYLHEGISNLGVDKKKTFEAAIQAQKCETEMETQYRKNIAMLFESDDIKMILKYRELYRHLSNAADKGDTAADTLFHCTFKNA